MPDPDDLSRPERDVDGAASRALFERKRGARRLLTGGAIALVLIAIGFGTMALLEGDEPEYVSVGADLPVTVASLPSDGALFEVLDMRDDALLEMGSLRSAVDDEELVAVWSEAGLSGDPPDVEFRQWIVVTITVPDDACPPTLERFERELLSLPAAAVTWTPVFVEPPGGCRQPLIPKTFVVAIDRHEVEPLFVLHLPGDEAYGFGDQELAVQVSPYGSLGSPDTTNAPTTTTSPASTAPTTTADAGPPPADPSAATTLWLSDAVLPASGSDLAVADSTTLCG